MSLADRIPPERRGLDGNRILNVLWFSSFAWAAVLLTLLLLNRLGMPIELGSIILTVVVAAAIAALSTLGRTMTGALFFFGGRLAGPAVTGIGGMNDWIGGAFLVLFFSLPLAGRMIVAPALMLGLLLQTALFASVFHRSGMATLPGFLVWRSGSRAVGLVSLIIAAVVLVFLILAEFSVAIDLFSMITRVDATRAKWLILVLVAVPCIFGGWLSMVIVNAVLAICMLISVAVPSIALGYFSRILHSGLAFQQEGGLLAPLTFQNSGAFSAESFSSVPELLAVLLVIACGAAALPHALSRLSLTPRSIDAVESAGWSALTIFLLLTMLSLSIGLIGAKPGSTQLAVLLRSEPVLHVLPYLAVFFAAFNLLSVCLLTFASAIVRGLRRSRNLDPGEQSIFSTRLLLTLSLVVLWFIPVTVLPSPATLLLLALGLSASALFAPMFGSAWLSYANKVSLLAALVSGAGVFLLTGILGRWMNVFPALDPFSAGIAGLLVSSTCIVVGYVMAVARTKSEGVANARDAHAGGTTEIDKVK